MASLLGAKADTSISIVATTSMIADTVQNIAGERANVVALMGEGVDPHAYRQTRSDVVKLGRADIVFANGLYLEAQLEPLLEKLARRQKVIPVGGFVPADELLRHDTYANKYDPHIWMNPNLWKHVVNGVVDTLSEFDADGAEHYQTNAARYLDELQSLAVYTKKVVETVPEQSRILVTAHDAFNYFGRAYGFHVVGIQGISTESEAGLNEVEAVVDLVVEKKISAVFIESSVSERNIRAIVEGAAARGQNVMVGGQLFSDATGTAGTYEGTLIGMLDHNVTTITRALGGTAPDRGMSQRLGGGS